jgi:hypothetical protein
VPELQGHGGKSWKAMKQVMKVMAETSTKSRVRRRSPGTGPLFPWRILGQGFLFVLGQAPRPAPGGAVEQVDEA